MKTTPSPYWALVADSGRARIFALSKEPALFHEVQELVSDSQRQTNRELVSDASGRIANVKGGPSSHAMQPRSNAHDLGETAFCSSLVEKLEQAANRNLFEGLVIFADPKTLGRLRQNMSKGLTARITGEVNRDLVAQPVGELERRVRAELGWSD